MVSLIEMAVAALAFWTENAQRFKMSHVDIDVASRKSSSRSKVVLLIGLFYFFYISVESKSSSTAEYLLDFSWQSALRADISQHPSTTGCLVSCDVFAMQI